MTLANISIDPKTEYDSTHTWQNANDRVAFQRAIAEGRPEEQKMGWALITADPDTPARMIQRQMTVSKIPPRYGYNREEPGIAEVVALTGDQNFGNLHDFEPTDYSGQPQAADRASSYPSLPLW